MPQPPRINRAKPRQSRPIASPAKFVELSKLSSRASYTSIVPARRVRTKTKQALIDAPHAGGNLLSSAGLRLCSECFVIVNRRNCQSTKVSRIRRLETPGIVFRVHYPGTHGSLQVFLGQTAGRDQRSLVRMSPIASAGALFLGQVRVVRSHPDILD